MAGALSRRWNQIYPSLVLLAASLEELGFYIQDGRVCIIEMPEVETDVRPL
jgi:hypothetical protein